MKQQKNINFFELLELGLIYEKKAQQIICDKFNTKILSTCNNYRYDFETLTNIKYECKFDKMSSITNNFFIETNTYNMNIKLYKKTGILSTISHFYILINEENNIINYYIIDTIKLKELVFKKGSKKCCLNKKTNIYSNGFIIKKTDIIENSNFIFSENV